MNEKKKRAMNGLERIYVDGEQMSSNMVDDSIKIKSFYIDEHNRNAFGLDGPIYKSVQINLTFPIENKNIHHKWT